jgi:hypothetical protein
MNAVAELTGVVPRSIFEERSPRPPIIGKIRLGTQVLSRSASQNPDIVKLYHEFVDRGETFETIGKVIFSRFNIKNALAQKNTPHFICRRSDFQNPEVADEILHLYGEDRGDGRKLWRFDALFAFDDWLANVPNQLAVWTASGRQYYSEYEMDGRRYCKTQVAPLRDARSNRAARAFGGRTIAIRSDDAIPDGVCEPLQCPQYQGNVCNMDASFFFVIPEIKGLGLVEMPTRSIYAVIKARAALQTVASARGGKIVGTRFSIEKHNLEISRIKDGVPMRQKQWIPILDSKIDLGALLERRDSEQGALEQANRVASLLTQSSSSEPEQPEVQQGLNGPAGQHGEPEHDSGSGGTVDDETEDLRHQMSDLLKRLGVTTEALQFCFRKYAHEQFGRGWAYRKNDLLNTVDQLRTALSCPEDFLRKIESVQNLNGNAA